MPELPPEIIAAVQRAAMPDFPRWQQMMNATGGCAQPVRLKGEHLTIDAQTGELIESYSTDDEPTGYYSPRAGTGAPHGAPPAPRSTGTTPTT
jgi:hypothetical protein